MKYIFVLCFFIFLSVNISYAEVSRERIISLSPNITETLFRMNLGDLLVGVTKNCNYPPEVIKITKVGGYNQISIEQIILLKPTVVLGMREGYMLKLKKKLDDLKIENHFFYSRDYKDVLDMIEFLSKRFNKNVESLTSSINKIFTEKLHCNKSALFLLNIKPLIAASSGSFINDIIRCGGFKNYVTNNKLAYPKINIETLYMKNPDYILISHHIGNSEIKLFEKRLQTLKINSKVFVVNEDIFVRPSYRIVEACMFLRTLKQ